MSIANLSITKLRWRKIRTVNTKDYKGDLIGSHEQWRATFTSSTGKKIILEDIRMPHVELNDIVKTITLKTESNQKY